MSVVWLFHRLLALVLLDAWVSLGVQVRALIGARGLLPIAPLLEAARPDTSFWQFPTVLWLASSDRALLAWIALGVGLAVLALVDRLARPAFALSALLYLGFAVAARTFTSFQWDNMLVECCVLAALAPAGRPARVPLLLFRVLLFKLYFESGIAKLESHLGDWLDGSAMTYYYETSPLPARGAWYAHHWPAAWHAVESRGALALELLAPLSLLAWGTIGRRLRLAAAACLTAFQLLNLLTANYGYFVYLSLALHVFFLDEPDVSALVVRGRRLLRHPLRAAGPLPAARGRAAALAAFAALYVGASTIEALDAFVGMEALNRLAPLRAAWDPFRVFNTYHLFGHITRQRIEPELQTWDGQAWTAQPLRHKPGPVDRAPAWVAPHQPRLDFQLWFYGLSYRSGTPLYVRNLLDRLCHDPAAVAGLFASPLPPRPLAVRIAFFDYHFTTGDERRARGAWWRRELIELGPVDRCASALAPDGASR